MIWRTYQHNQEAPEGPRPSPEYLSAAAAAVAAVSAEESKQASLPGLAGVVDIDGALAGLLGPPEAKDRQRERDVADCETFNVEHPIGSWVEVGGAPAKVIGAAIVAPPWWRANVRVEVAGEARTVDLRVITRST